MRNAIPFMALSEPGGMYCTKVRCTVRATEGIAGGIIPTSKYITIGDSYVDVKDTVPGRWKSKQFAMNRAPSLCPEQKLTGQGYFGYNKYAFKAPEKGKDPYVEQVRKTWYVKVFSYIPVARAASYVSASFVLPYSLWSGVPNL